MLLRYAAFDITDHHLYIITGNNSYSLEINLAMLHDLEEDMKQYKYSYRLVQSLKLYVSFKFHLWISNNLSCVEVLKCH